MPSLRTILWWGAIIFVIYFIVTSPHEAAVLVHKIGGWLSTAAHGFSAFVTSL